MEQNAVLGFLEPEINTHNSQAIFIRADSSSKVQGFESEVLDGIDWKNPPEWIVVEDDLGKSFDHIAYFSKRGYFWVAGEHDKVFSRISRHVTAF